MLFDFFFFLPVSSSDSSSFSSFYAHRFTEVLVDSSFCWELFLLIQKKRTFSLLLSSVSEAKVSGSTCCTNFDEMMNPVSSRWCLTLSPSSPLPHLAVIGLGPWLRGTCQLDSLCRRADWSLRASCGEMATESLFIIQGFARARQALSPGSSPSLQQFIIGLNAAEREKGARHLGPLLARP